MADDPDGLGKKPSDRLDRMTGVRLPPSVDLRVRNLSAELGQTQAATLRALIASALGDDARTIAVRESAYLVSELRRDITKRFNQRLDAIADEVVREFAGDLESIDDEDNEAEDELRRQRDERAARRQVPS
jgi:hypothetical protein